MVIAINPEIVPRLFWGTVIIPMAKICKTRLGIDVALARVAALDVTKLDGQSIDLGPLRCCIILEDTVAARCFACD